jgi:hypothetical protein
MSSRLVSCLYAAVCAGFAVGAEAQAGPAAPASVPVALATRDPSAQRGPVRVITAPPRPVAEDTTAAHPDSYANVAVQGLKGTLNKGDVHQTMEARQDEFDRCIRESQRSLRWVSGAIRFAFRVDGAGRIADAHATHSTLGHRALERCLTAAVQATQFPKPAGRATAEFSWGLHVEPAGARPLEELKPKALKSLVRKQARELFKTCEIRRRTRFQITAYLAANGHLLSAGAVPLRSRGRYAAASARQEDKVDCVLEQFAKWHLPKLARSSKVSFELR